MTVAYAWRLKQPVSGIEWVKIPADEDGAYNSMSDILKTDCLMFEYDIYMERNASVAEGHRDVIYSLFYKPLQVADNYTLAGIGLDTPARGEVLLAAYFTKEDGRREYITIHRESLSFERIHSKVTSEETGRFVTLK